MVDGTWSKKCFNIKSSTEKLEAIHTELANGIFKDYELISGLIYKSSGDLRQLVVPKGMINDIISQAHEQGHFAVRKLWKEFSSNTFLKKCKKELKNLLEIVLPLY